VNCVARLFRLFLGSGWEEIVCPVIGITFEKVMTKTKPDVARRIFEIVDGG
jgi:hypothetical protein